MARVESKTLLGQALVCRTVITPRDPGNERGIALIISLVMLVLLGILGTWALDTASTELRIAGNYRNNDIAFYTADACIGYASNPQLLEPISLPITNPETYLQANAPQIWPAAPVNIPVSAAPATTCSPTVMYVGCGPMPGGTSPSAATSGDVDPNLTCGYKTYGLYFAVNSVGSSANSSATVNIESFVALAKSN